MKNWCILLLAVVGLNSGCSLFGGRSATQTSDITENSANLRTANPTASASDGLLEFNSREGRGDFSKSIFVARDFLSVISRVPDFVPGQTQFSSALPRTRYGEILMEQLRQAGFAIVLGDNARLPALGYSIDLPSKQSPDVHTFYVSVGELQLKRSYEIFGDRIAPVSEMLMSGIDARSLRPLQTLVNRTANQAFGQTVDQTDVASASLKPRQILNTGALKSAPKTLANDQLGVQRINELARSDEDWDPLDANLYESRESVYQAMFTDSTRDYAEVSSQVLIFPNDSLVLGSANKNYLFELANRVRRSDDIVRVVGCSHGKSSLANGNENLAKGRAIRVREELLLAGVPDSSILHEACWANVHFDEELPRRGVVVIHLRPVG